MNLNELLRLDGVHTEARPGQILVSFELKCNGDAKEVIDRIRAVIKRVVDCELSFDDPLDDWRALLPKWFIDHCASEITRAEAEELMRTSTGYAELSTRWSLSGFLHWFRPEMRSWYWYAGHAETRGLATMVLITDGMPIATGALEHLTKAAGAVRMYEVGIRVIQ
jgi:hypothetical protein